MSLEALSIDYKGPERIHKYRNMKHVTLIGEGRLESEFTMRKPPPKKAKLNGPNERVNLRKGGPDNDIYGYNLRSITLLGEAMTCRTTPNSIRVMPDVPTHSLLAYFKALHNLRSSVRKCYMMVQYSHRRPPTPCNYRTAKLYSIHLIYRHIC
jgi:hypothetical protein